MSITNPKFSGLTDDQVLMVLGDIAATAKTMSEMCRASAERHGTEEVAYTFHALKTMLNGVGTLADLPTGGNCVGDYAAWVMGSSFDSWRKDVEGFSHD